MAGGKNKKKGQKKVGKEAPSTSLATDASPPMFPDTDFLLGYFDLSYSSLQRKDPRNALKIMWKSCEMHFTHPILHYWQSWFALEVFHEIYSGINYKREEILNPLSIARNAARRATIMSPHDIEFFRFYIEILAAISIYDEDVKEAIKETIKEAIEEGDQMLTLPEETMVFQEKLCSTHKKGAIITAIRALKEKLCSEMEGSISESPKSPLSKPIPFYRRVDKPKEKQIAVKLMPEIEQKKWRRSCWELMSDDKKVEFLALKYEDLRTFFLDKHLKHSKEVLMKVFSILIFGDSLLLPSCYTCGLFFEDYKKFIHHVRSNHIFQLSEHLKKLLPEDDKCEIRLPDTDDSKLSITVDKAKLTLHICNGTKGEISFEPENLKSLLPDPETFVNWLNLDEYAEKKMDDIIAAEGVIFRLLNNNSNELKSLCLEKHEKFTMVEKALVLIEWHCLEELKKMNCQKSTVLELLKAVHENLNEKFKECPENVISIQHQFDVISDMIMSELDSTKDTEVLLSSDQLEVHMDLVFKSRKELLAKECESFDSKLREKNTLKNHLECELSCMCRFDYSKQLLPYLGLYIKAQLAELVLTYATEQADKLAEQLTMEEAKNNAPGGSNLSEQSVKNPNMKYRVSRAYDDYEVAHQQEGTTELFVPCRSVSALSANLRMKSGSSTTAYRWR